MKLAVWPDLFDHSSRCQKTTLSQTYNSTRKRSELTTGCRTINLRYEGCQKSSWTPSLQLNRNND